MGPVKVLIADDHTLIREGLVKVISLYSELEVVGEASDGVEALEKAGILNPDIILMDIHMPRMDGLQAAISVREKYPHIKVIALTVDDSEQKVVEVIKAGVRGYMLKDVGPDALASTIKAVYSGETVMHPQITSKLFRELERVEFKDEAQKPEICTIELTPRELEILKLIAQGIHNRDIASQLFISEKTVKNHITSIFRKLEVEDRTQAALSAIKLRLVSM